MPSTTCLGCEEQKRMKGDKFYFVNSIPNPLLVINNLRQTYNTKKRKLVEAIFHQTAKSVRHIIN